jgi:hypothetical protein
MLSEAGQVLNTGTSPDTENSAPEPPERPLRRKTDRTPERRNHFDTQEPRKPSPAKLVSAELDPSIDFGPRNDRFSAPRRREPLPVVKQTTLSRDQACPTHSAEPMHGNETEPLPIEEVRTQLFAESEGRFGARTVDFSSGVTLDGVDRMADHAPSILPPMPPRDTRWMPVSGTPNRAQPPDDRQRSMPVEVPMARSLDPIDEADRLRTMPRCCATCRDFKPVGDGSRGWCENPYAFTERRMVESGQLSCRSSFGSWWLPTDDVWLERADTTYHSRPTPILDEITRTGTDFDDKQTMGSHPD